MSQPCAIVDCKRTSRALCHCCQQNLCRDHLNKHDDVLNEQLNPFADEINELNDRLNHINLKSLLDHAYGQLDEFRVNCHRKVDRFVNEKQRHLDEYISTKVNSQIEAIARVRTIIQQLLDNQNTTTADLNAISSTIQSVQREITQIEHKSIDLDINALEIDDKLIRVVDRNVKRNFNLSALMPPVNAINRAPECPKPLIANNRVLLIHHDNHLCLLSQEMTMTKSVPWTQGWIWDMCWSTTLSRFFIITLNDIFMLHEETMLLERLEINERYALSSCTCSDTSFYVTTKEAGSAICEFSLSPTIELIHRYKTEDLCQADESIQDMVFHKGTIAFIIENETSSTKRMELRLAQTLEKLWSVQFDIVDTLHNPYRLCLFNYNEWIVIDWKSAQLFHITNDGQIEGGCQYEPVPYRCCQFGPNTLVISAKNSINFHKIGSG